MVDLPEPLGCCVCGGAHHAMQCERARRFIAECVTPRPLSSIPKRRHRDHDLICEVLRRAMHVIDEADAAHRYATWLRHRQ